MTKAANDYLIREYRAGDRKLCTTVEPCTMGPTGRGESRIADNPAWTLLYQGRPVACGGVIELWPGVGEVWLTINPLIAERTLTLFRQMVRKRRELVEDFGFNRLQAVIRADFMHGRRLALRFGFRCEGYLHAYLPDGSDAMIFAWFG